MVLDIAKPKNKQSTIQLVMRGRDAAKELTLKVDISKVFTIAFSEIQIIVNHNSQLDGLNETAKRWMNTRRPYISFHSRGKEKISRTMVSYLEQSRKNEPMKLRSDFRAVVSKKNRLHHESGEQVEEPIHPDQYSRWHPSSNTSWWDKSGWNWKRAHKILFD